MNLSSKCRAGARLGWPLLVLAWVGCVAVDDVPASTSDQPPNGDTPAELKPRVVAPKLAARAYGPALATDQLVLKFVEGSRVRMRAGKLTQEPAASSQDTARLQRRGMSHAALPPLLEDVHALLGAHPAVSLARLFRRAEAVLEEEQRAGEASSGEELADLNLYYAVHVPSERAAALLDQLNASELVELAYPAPQPAAPPAVDIAPTTPSLVTSQGYLEPAPVGIDARFAWSRNGGNGSGVRIFDVEYSWNTEHEDLGAGSSNAPALALRFNGCEPCADTSCSADRQHGTAVLGVLKGEDNGYGVTGVSFGASYGLAGQFASGSPCDGYSTADAIDAAVANTQVGDVILIEAQTQGPIINCPQTSPPPCGWLTPPSATQQASCIGQFGLVPVEWYQAEYDAIRAATSNGRIVVEAGANGQQDLDDPVFNDLFNRSTRDSGAIIVGGGNSQTRATQCYSSAGSRIDVQGWADSVVSTGYGDLSYNSGDTNQWYTTGFGGTSSASALIAGAAADLQGVRKASGRALYTSTQLRARLVARGTAQPSDTTRPIGPLPNLRAILAPAQPPATGALAALRQSTSVTSTMAVGSDGALYVRWRGSNGVWRGPVAVSAEDFAPPGAGVAMAVRTANEANAFVVGYDGRLYVTRELNDGAWSTPSAISTRGFAPAGAELATGKSSVAQLDVFVLASDGALKVSSNPGSGWLAPATLTSAAFAPPAGSLSTLIRGAQLHVFVVGNDGAIQFVNFNGFFWSAPAKLSAVDAATPGAAVRAGYVGGLVNVFAIDKSGVLQMYLDGGLFWSGPNALPAAGVLLPASALAVSQYAGNDRAELLFVDQAGSLQALTSNGFGRWNSSVLSAPGLALPGSRVALATQGSTQLAAFAVQDQGLVRTLTGNGTSWSGLTPLP